MSYIATLIPDDADVFEIASRACAQHLNIITNGKRAVLSPVIPEGWTKLRVGINTPKTAKLIAD